MFKFLHSKLAKAVATGLVIGNLGFGMAGATFAQTAPNPFGQTTPDSGQALTADTLGQLLQSLNLGANKEDDNGQISYSITVPGSNGAPATSIVVGISPNNQYVNIYYVATNINPQSLPSQQLLLTMLEDNQKSIPAYLEIENNLLVLRDNLLNNGVTAQQLMAELKFFYSQVQAVQQLVPAQQPTTPQPSPNPFS